MTPTELRARRKALGLTQQGLATELGISSTQVARWERGVSGWAPYLPLALAQLEAQAARPVAAGAITRILDAAGVPAENREPMYRRDALDMD